nr:hypothetical protein OG461_12880 [Streptomyces sp. NBC_00995]
MNRSALQHEIVSLQQEDACGFGARAGRLEVFQECTVPRVLQDARASGTFCHARERRRGRFSLLEVP